MWEEHQIQIIVSAIDEVSANMKNIEKVARDTKKKLEEDMVIKLRANVAALDLGLKEARKKLSEAKDLNAKFWLTMDVQRVQRELTEAKRRLNNYLNTWDENLSRLQAKFNGIWEKIKGIFWGAWEWAKWVAIGSIGAMAKSVVHLADQYEQAKISFTTMLGSADKASDLLTKLSAFAKKTPFELSEVRENAKQLLAMGISAEKIIPTMKALGDVSAGLSVPMERLALNYGQVMTKGKLAGQELKDFTTAGVPLLDELSKNLGKSKTEIQAMVSKGQISAEMVTEAFRTMTSEWGKFADLMSAQSGTLSGMWSNFSDSLAQIGEKIWLYLLPWLKESVDWIARLFNKPQNAIEWEIAKLDERIRTMEKVISKAQENLNKLNEDFRNGKISSEDYNREFEKFSGIIATAQGDIAKYNKELEQQQALLDLNNEITAEHTKTLAELNQQEQQIQSQIESLREQRNLWIITEEEYRQKLSELIEESKKLKKAKDDENISSEKEVTLNKALARAGLSAIEIKKLFASLKIKNGADINALGAEAKAANTTAMGYIRMQKAKAQATIIENTRALKAAKGDREGKWWAVFADMKDDIVWNEWRIGNVARLNTELKDAQKVLQELSKIENAYLYDRTPLPWGWEESKQKSTSKWGGKSSRWWGWSAKSKTENLKKELEKQKELEIQAVKDSELTEEAKMLKIYDIKEKYDKRTKELEGKTDDDLLKQSEEYMKSLKEQREQSYKDHKKKADEASKDIKKYTENLDKIKKKFEEIKEKAGESLRSVKHDLDEMDKTHIKDLGARYYEVKKQIRDNESDNPALKYLDAYNKETLQKRKEAWTKEVGDLAIDKILEQLKLKEELLYLEKKTTKEQQEQAKIEAEKSESVKLVEKYEKEKRIKLEHQRLLESYTASGEVGLKGIDYIRDEHGDKTDKLGYRDAEKKAYIEITDFKNQEYARDLLNQQTKLAEEYASEQKKLNDSKELALKHSQEIIKIWENETQNYRGELLKRADITRDYVNQVKAMMAEINQAKSNAQGSVINNNQTTNSNNKTTNYHITNVGSTSRSFPGGYLN